MKIITITVSPEGKSRVETKGFSGSACRQASEFLESALGQRTEETLTSEFHQSAEAEHVQQQRTTPP